LSRNKQHIKEELEWFKKKNVRLKILDLPTSLITVPEGQEWILDMITNILIEVLGTIAEQERNKIKVRQAEGIAEMPIVDGKRVSAKTGRGFGRQEKRPENFSEVLSKQKAGLLTLKEALSEAGVGRTRWYELAREYA
jgi:DNA invertase Pin-like site-specific DNA recombinase